MRLQALLGDSSSSLIVSGIWHSIRADAASSAGALDLAQDAELPSYVKRLVTTATITVYVYDCLCTLDKEVDLVWCRPWKFGAFLFFFNRYLPIFDLVLSLQSLVAFHTTESCYQVIASITWLSTVGIGTSEFILILRTIAIWNRKRIIAIPLTIYFFGSLIACLVIAHLWLTSLIFVPTIPGIHFGCFITSMNRLLIFNYATVLLTETTIVVLTLLRAYKHLRFSNSQWVHQLYKRGFLYYVFLLLITILNIAFPFFAVPAIQHIFSDPQRALHSLICNRIIFFILSQQDKDALDLNPDARTGNPNMAVITTVLDTYLTRDDEFETSEEEYTEEDLTTSTMRHRVGRLSYRDRDPHSYRSSWM